MKKKSFLCFVIILLNMNIFADHNDTCAKVVFYSSKETLRRILQPISRQEKGAYLSFGKRDVELAITPDTLLPENIRNLQGEMRETFRLSGPSVFRALPYPCKGINIDQIPLEQLPNICMTLVKEITPYWGTVAQLYDQDCLVALAQTHNDMHYATRFLKRLKNTPNLLVVGQEATKLLFGSSCNFISVPEIDYTAQLDRIEQECLQRINKDQYTIVVFEAGFVGRILAKRLWHKLEKVFLFDLGELVNTFVKKDSNYAIDYEKFSTMLSRDIHILSTAAVINFQFEFRKNEYLKSLGILHDYWYEPYIVESCASAPTFLDQHCKNVYYSHSNNSRLRNKGVNEARSMIHALNHYNFHDDDLIVKMTGRYYFKSDSFLRLVEETPDIDGYVTLDPRTFFSFAGCYGLRYKYFKDMLNSINFEQMERNMIDLERIVLEYMRKIEQEQGAKILYLDEVDVKAFVANYWDYDW